MRNRIRVKMGVCVGNVGEVGGRMFLVGNEGGIGRIGIMEIYVGNKIRKAIGML
nr:hypothetical protein [Bacillus pumilus]